MSKREPERELFGTTPQGEEVHKVRLRGGGLTAEIMTWGASVQSLHLEGHPSSLVLGFPRFEDYLAHGLYFGASVGRFANRLANGRFELNGRSFQGDRNFLGKHMLHGGAHGTASQNWTIADLGTSHVDLTLRQPDGMMGFPGSASITCSYVLKDNGVLHVSYVTRSDAETIAGMTHHSYFTLDGDCDVRDHDFQIHAPEYLPVDKEMIPTGEIVRVAGTDFDFNSPRTIAAATEAGTIYDHNFCVSHHRRNLQEVARVHSAKSRITMAVVTTEPGLQFYAAHAMSVPVQGLHAVPYGSFSGFCMEPQNWPDAPNQPAFPSARLLPHEELRQVSEFQFVHL